MKFTYSAYKDLVSILRKNNYSFASYHDYSNFDKCVIMRHDIDTSLDKAVSLAKLEQQLGIRSTYFILISSPFYNLISKAARDIVEDICSAGHEIGLHFDELNYTNRYYRDIGGVENAIFREIKLLEKILGKEIKSVSMHRPSKQTLQADYDLGYIKNSYGKEFFNGFKYVSDSRRRWSEDIRSVILSGEYNKLHILTHAFCYNEVEEDFKTALYKFVKQGISYRYDILKDNITNFEDILEREEIE